MFPFLSTHLNPVLDIQIIQYVKKHNDFSQNVQGQSKKANCRAQSEVKIDSLNNKIANELHYVCQHYVIQSVVHDMTVMCKQLNH